MRLVHAMKVPPGVGTGPGNRGNPPFEEIRHYFFDMGRDGLLAFFEIPKGAKPKGDRDAIGTMQHVAFAVSPETAARLQARLTERGIDTQLVEHRRERNIRFISTTRTAFALNWRGNRPMATSRGSSTPLPRAR
jgi:hypothetical protein